MCYVIIVLSVICVAFIVWAGANHKKRKSKPPKKEKPPFRTEETLEEYGKPMKDQAQSPVDFDDA